MFVARSEVTLQVGDVFLTIIVLTLLGCLVLMLALTYRTARVLDRPQVVLLDIDSARHPLEALAATLGARVTGEALVQLAEGYFERVVWLKTDSSSWGEVVGSQDSLNASLSWHAHGPQGYWMTVPARGFSLWQARLQTWAGYGRAPQWRLVIADADLERGKACHQERAKGAAAAPSSTEAWRVVLEQRIQWDSDHQVSSRHWERVGSEGQRRMTWLGAFHAALVVPVSLFGKNFTNLPLAFRHWAWRSELEDLTPERPTSSANE